MGVLTVYDTDLHAWCLQSPEEGTGFPRTGVTDGHKLPCGFRES